MTKFFVKSENLSGFKDGVIIQPYVIVSFFINIGAYL